MKHTYLVLAALFIGFAANAQHLKCKSTEVVTYEGNKHGVSKKINAVIDINAEQNKIDINEAPPTHLTIIKRLEANVENKGAANEARTMTYLVKDSKGAQKKAELVLFIHAQNGVNGALIVHTTNGSSLAYSLVLL